MASTTKPVIVCVSGAVHAPSSWDAVAEPLRQRGFLVLAPPLATCGPPDAAAALVGKTAADDVALIHATLLPLLDAGHEAVIVAHSYGSVPATYAVEGQTVAERRARVLGQA